MTLALETAPISHPRMRTAWALVAGFGAVFVLSSAADAILHALNYYPNDGTVGTDSELAVALAYRTRKVTVTSAVVSCVPGSTGVESAVLPATAIGWTIGTGAEDCSLIDAIDATDRPPACASASAFARASA